MDQKAFSDKISFLFGYHESKIDHYKFIDNYISLIEEILKTEEQNPSVTFMVGYFNIKIFKNRYNNNFNNYFFF